MLTAPQLEHDGIYDPRNNVAEFLLLKMEVSGHGEQLGGLTVCFYPAICSCPSGRQRDRQLGSTEPWSEECSKTEQESESYGGLFLH